MASGTALMTAMFTPYLKTTYASRLDTSCFIKDVPLFHPGLPTALSEVIVLLFGEESVALYNILSITELLTSLCHN